MIEIALLWEEHGVDADGRPWLVDYYELPSISEETVGMADAGREG